MVRDYLGEIGELLKEFDKKFGSTTRAVLVVEKEAQGADVPVKSQVTIDPATGYAPTWGKRVHPIFEPPPPGQTRLVREGKRLVYKK